MPISGRKVGGLVLIALLSSRIALAGDGTTSPSIKAPLVSAPQAPSENGGGARIGAIVLLGGAAASLGVGAYLAETGDHQSQTGDHTNRTAIGMGVLSASFVMAVLGIYLWSNYPPHTSVQVGLTPSSVLLQGRF